MLDEDRSVSVGLHVRCVIFQINNEVAWGKMHKQMEGQQYIFGRERRPYK